MGVSTITITGTSGSVHRSVGLKLTVGDAQDHDMAWYATQELPFLLELL